jgi:cell division protein FtsQ
MMNKGKKFKRLYSWLKFTMVIIMLLIIIALIAMTPLFNIKRVMVSGNSHYDSNAIISTTGIQIGENGFKAIGQSLIDLILLRHTQAEMNIVKNCHYIKEANVKYIIPSSIRITVSERTPVAFVPFLGTSLLIDGESYIIDTFKDEGDFKLPEIKGLKFDYFELGEKLPVDDSGKVDNAVAVLNALSNSDKDGNYKIMDLINSVDVGDLNNICIFIDSRIVVNIGDMQELDYKIESLRHIYYRNIKKEDKGILDFSKGKNPVFTPES